MEQCRRQKLTKGLKAEVTHSSSKINSWQHCVNLQIIHNNATIKSLYVLLLL